MVDDPNGADPINSFALVSYIPGHLGEFLNGMRQKLVTGCIAYPHVTVLPPRPISVDPVIAAGQIRSQVEMFPSFTVEIASVEIFPVTNVIYAEIGAGRSELLEMHEALNSGHLRFTEPFYYHPHITLAQGVELEELREIHQEAQRKWRDYRHERSFTVDTLTFVQNTVDNRWKDLVECELRGAPSLRV